MLTSDQLFVIMALFQRGMVYYKRLIIMKTFNFNITFICANTNQEKTLFKVYRAKNYLDAKIGIREYCNTNKTMLKLLEITQA